MLLLLIDVVFPIKILQKKGHKNVYKNISKIVYGIYYIQAIYATFYKAALKKV